MLVKSVGNIEAVEFRNLVEFRDYVLNTPYNTTFAKARRKASVAGDREFTQTRTFEEALDLFNNGWSTMAEKLTQMMKIEDQKQQVHTTRKTVLDVAGYQPVVPLYLNNVPTNMVNRKNVPAKQKVVTINKDVTYRAMVSSDQIVVESLKSLMIIRKLEAQGTKVNLNIVLSVNEDGKRYIVKIRIKSAGERLNVSKLAFALVHPSMLRRLFFRFLEVHPGVPQGYTFGYGQVDEAKVVKIVLDKVGDKEYVLPAIIEKDMASIRTIEDVEALL